MSITTPFGTFGTGTVAAIIHEISRSRVAAHQHALLGDMPFDLVTYLEGQERKVAADFAEHAVIGGKPRLQWVGHKLDEITWRVVLHAGFCNPRAELDRLEAAVRDHQARLLVFANGDVKGWFVLTEVSETYQATQADGTPVWVEASLCLREHVLPPEVSTSEAKERPAAETWSTSREPKKPAKARKRKPTRRAANKPAVRTGG